MPRLYREAPLNSIWEGSGNVIALDVMRAVSKAPEALDRVLGEIRASNDPRIRTYSASIEKDFPEEQARRFAERIALALQASLLVRFSPPDIADAFIASRLEGDHGHVFGTLRHAISDFQ